jgi:hypothetical protein
MQRRRGKQCRDKKAMQAKVFAHVFPAKIAVLQDSITSERALFSPEEISYILTKTGTRPDGLFHFVLYSHRPT